MDQIVSLLVKAGVTLLALIAVLVGGYEVFAKNNGATAASEQSQIATNIQALFNGGMQARNYSSISNQVAISAAAIPKSMLNGDGQTISGPWGGSTVSLQPWNGTAGFEVDWDGVDSDACTSLARSQNPQAVWIGGTTVQMSDANAAADIATACKAGSGTTSPRVAFLYAN